MESRKPWESTDKRDAAKMLHALELAAILFALILAIVATA